MSRCHSIEWRSDSDELTLIKTTDMTSAPPGTSGLEPRARTRTVVLCLVLTLLALAPGLWLKLDPETPLLAGLKNALAGISWWNTPRFWMGLSGTALMAVMLLYPLRKLLASGRFLGSVGGWFTLHMALGLAGPVLVLYHADFGHGGFNATVALWAMLVVTASGVIGHFVYTSASASFYAGKERARAELDQIAAKLATLDAMFAARQKFIADLDQFQAELLTPRQGVLASLASRLRLEQRRRALAHQLSWLLAECARDLRLSEAEHQRLRRLLGGHFAAYMRVARHTSTRSLREQLWARWRLFHLPIFLLMVVATSLHVWAVWDIDDPATAEPVPEVSIAPAAVAPAPVPARRPASVPAQANRPLAPPPGASAPAAQTAPAPNVTIVPTRSALPPPVRTSANAREGASEAERAASSEPAGLSSATSPEPALRPTSVPAAPEPALGKADDEISKLLADETRRVADAPATQPVTPATVPAPALPSPPTAPVAKTRTLIEQIADFKAKRQLGQFSHSESETGFALTGKHVEADCTKCHTTPLKETPSAGPRPCISCHAKDDNHKGRRPSCGNCHLTTSFKDRKPKAK